MLKINIQISSIFTSSSKTYLRCQNRKCPICWLLKALLIKNFTKSQSWYNSCFIACVSWRRYSKRSASLEMYNRINDVSNTWYCSPFTLHPSGSLLQTSSLPGLHKHNREVPVIFLQATGAIVAEGRRLRLPPPVYPSPCSKTT